MQPLVVGFNYDGVFSELSACCPGDLAIQKDGVHPFQGLVELAQAFYSGIIKEPENVP
jgi:hypothetical protein